MAAKFNSDQQCEGKECQSITEVTYYVREKKRLCDDCASSADCIGRVRMGGPQPYCMEHKEDVEWYCKTHGVPLCHSCAFLHQQPDCVKQAIGEAVADIRERLKALKENVKSRVEINRIFGDKIDQCRKDKDSHLKALKAEIDSVISDAIENDKDREKEEAAKINQEIDERNQKLQEEIRKNNKERNRRLELNCLNADKGREPIKNKHQHLYEDTEKIAEEMERKIGELEKAWKYDKNTNVNAMQTLDTVLGDDRSIITAGQRLCSSLSDELKKPLNDDVKRITRSILSVKFLKGSGRERYDGRIGGYDAEWKLIDKINIKIDTIDIKISYPFIVGCIDDHQVIITDDNFGSQHTYTFDMNTKRIQKVITDRVTSCVCSCALLKDDKIVCGRYYKGCTGDSLNGCISMYDRQWKPLYDVTIPRNTTRSYSWVDVAVDHDGMVIAAERGQSKIYVINPADGKFMEPIRCRHDVLMRGVLSSGHIIAQSHPIQRVLIIDRQGGQRAIQSRDVIANTCINPMTDDFYVVTSYDWFKTCVIDQACQIIGRNDVKKKRVTSFHLSTTLQDRRGHLLSSRVMMTSAGKMVACNGENILVFENRLIL